MEIKQMNLDERVDFKRFFAKKQDDADDHRK